MAKIAVEDAFCWIKNAQKSISADASPRTPRNGLAVFLANVNSVQRSCTLLSQLKFLAIFLCHSVPWSSIDFTDIVPGEPLCWEFKRKKGSEI